MVQRSARLNCFRLFWHCGMRAASRAACTAGSSSAIKMPMIVMTTRSSTSVKGTLASLTIYHDKLSSIEKDCQKRAANRRTTTK